MTDDKTDDDLSISFDKEAVVLILEGLALLPYGQVKNLYEALREAAVKQWGEES